MSCPDQPVNQMPAVTVDARGLSCPMPLLKLRKALHSLEPGDSVHLMATDPHSQADIARYCEKSGQTLLQQASQQDHFEFWIVKNS